MMHINIVIVIKNYVDYKDLISIKMSKLLKGVKEKEEKYKIDKSYYQWAIVRKDDNQFMGEIGLVLYNKKYNAIQIGYHLGKIFRVNGYMQEVLKTVLSNDFEYSRTLNNYRDEIYEGTIDKYKITRQKWYELNKKIHLI